MAAVVVFCTTYALILPAVTQERAVAQDPGVSVSGITISKITTVKDRLIVTTKPEMIQVKEI